MTNQERTLKEEELRAGKHRGKVGGDWARKGPLQLNYLQERGLQPHHKLLDVGCGSLRGGIQFLRHLEPGNYYGIEAQGARIQAGWWEVEQRGLLQKRPNLMVDDSFAVHRFLVEFDCALAVSVFTHISLNQIVRCLKRVGGVLSSGGEFHASFLEAPTPAHLEPIERRGGNFTYQDRNPYHYALEELSWAATVAGLQAEYVGDWGHPGQQMIVFHK